MNIIVIIKIVDVVIHIKISSLETFLGCQSPFFSKIRKTSKPVTFKNRPFKATPQQDHHTPSEFPHLEAWLPPSLMPISSDFYTSRRTFFLLHVTNSLCLMSLPYPTSQKVDSDWPPASYDGTTVNSCCQGHPSLCWHQSCSHSATICLLCSCWHRRTSLNPQCPLSLFFPPPCSLNWAYRAHNSQCCFCLTLSV